MGTGRAAALSGRIRFVEGRLDLEARHRRWPRADREERRDGKDHGPLSRRAGRQQQGLMPMCSMFARHARPCAGYPRLTFWKQVVDGRDISAFTRVFDALCPAMTRRARRDDQLRKMISAIMRYTGSNMRVTSPVAASAVSPNA